MVNGGVKLLGFDLLATLKHAVANLSSRPFAAESGKGKTLGMSLERAKTSTAKQSFKQI